MCWDESNFDVAQNRYCREAYEAGKWAFVSDYARLWVLVRYGGIYLDTDVELLRSLDSFLEHDAFAGFEDDRSIQTGIMGCGKGFSLFNEFLEEYEDRLFVGLDGSLDTTTNVRSITEACLRRGLEPNGERQVVEGLALYPMDWLCAKSYSTGLLFLTENTHAIHHFSGSWLDDRDRAIRAWKHTIMKRLPGMNPRVAYAAAQVRYGLGCGDFDPLFDSARRLVRSWKGDRKAR